MPNIDLSTLTASDMRSVIAMQSMDGQDKIGAYLDLLERITPGGLATIPFAETGAYLKELDTQIGEALSPKA
jgi:hypothetical protein